MCFRGCCAEHCGHTVGYFGDSVSTHNNRASRRWIADDISCHTSEVESLILFRDYGKTRLLFPLLHLLHFLLDSLIIGPLLKNKDAEKVSQHKDTPNPQRP